jgi:hypothetical protein
MPSGTLHRILIDGLSIILIDLLLAGDNALVIAMAVRGLSSAPVLRLRCEWPLPWWPPSSSASSTSNSWEAPLFCGLP